MEQPKPGTTSSEKHLPRPAAASEAAAAKSVRERADSTRSSSAGSGRGTRLAFARALVRRSDLVFFLTGLATLVYQSVWGRLLARILGSDASGMAVVIATFMGGMGLGAVLLAGAARRTRQPVRFFAGLELFVAAWAAASPFLLRSLPPIDGLVPRALLCAAVLLLPTLAMGATFPLMARIQIRREEDTAAETGAFYGANTLGAAAGALVGPFVLMPWLGFTGTLLAAAVLEAAAAALALVWLTAVERAPEADTPRAELRPASERLMWVAFLVGVSSLALEVELLRLLTMLMGASVYAFALVLAVFLLGLGLGSRLVRNLPGSSAVTLFRATLAVPALVLAGLGFIAWKLGEPDLFGSLANRAPSGAGPLGLWLSNALIAGFALLAPAIAFGMALPAAAGALAARHPRAPLERMLGWLYAFDTAGAVLGSLAGAFLFLAWLGPRWALVAALVPVALAARLLSSGRALQWWGGLGAALALWLFLLAPPREPEQEVLRLRSDAHTTAAVEEMVLAGRPVRTLRVNGKAEASTAPIDVRLQQLLGYVPGLLAGEVKRALVIGLGTGMTAGALLDLPAIERVTVIEISPAVRECARLFEQWNRGIVTHPRAEVRIADGRHALATSTERFDLITSDPVHPWTRGSSDLYTLEHFTAMAEHLAPGGVASQWLPLYELSTLDLQTIIATWCGAFAHTSAWLSAYDLILVGSSGQLPGEETLASRPFPPPIAAAMAQLAVHSGAELCALQVARDPELRAFAGDVAPMRDDRPVIEFRAPLSYLAGYSVEVLAWAGREEFVDLLPAASRERGRDVRASLARFLGRIPYGLSAAVENYERELLALPALPLQ